FVAHDDLRVFLAATCPPFLALLGMAALFPAPAPGIERRGAAFAVEVFRYALGVAAGVLVVWAGIAAGAWLHQGLSTIWEPGSLPDFLRSLLRASQTF